MLLRWTDGYRYGVQWYADNLAEFVEHGIDALIEARRATVSRQKHDGRTRRNYREFPSLELHVYDPNSRGWYTPVRIEGDAAIPLPVSMPHSIQWIGERAKGVSDADRWREISGEVWGYVHSALEWGERLSRLAGRIAEEGSEGGREA